ncbi:MAG: phosphotransferase [Candidatus Dormibacteria bacterium]
MKSWAAEVEVGEAEARRLINSQFPDVDTTLLRLLGQGWDSTAWVAGEKLLFRFPRRAIVVPGLERELSILGSLAPRLPLAVPVTTHRGRPDAGYPFPFAGSELIPGTEVAASGLSQGDLDRLALAYGEFLARLHSPGLRARGESARLPVDPMGRGDMARTVPVTRENLESLRGSEIWTAPVAVDRWLARAERLSSGEEPVLVHGDLHLRHLLAHRGELTGVIDWIDVCLAPRSVDLVCFWSVFSPMGRALVLDAYGQVASDDLLRARVLSLRLCAILALYAHDTGDGGLLAAAVAGLERTAQG